MPPPPELARLVERFDRNLDDYRAGRYKETQVRLEFVDPLFKLLGWDVDNKADFSKPSDVKLHDLMVSLVRRMLDLHKRLPEAKTPHEKKVTERDIAATDRRIDELVHGLYGLTKKEIRILEEATGK